jgi:Holliday junction resolvase RusA-like endonuclease
MLITFNLPGSLPAMNDIIDAAKGHWGGYRSMKEDNTEHVRLKLLNAPRLEKPVEVTIRWITSNLKQDPDNLMAGQKFIFDGLVAAKVIPNDTRKWVKKITHEFGLDRQNPRVEVEVSEVK